jgi:hypothetical protein
MMRNPGKAISLALALAACGPTGRGNGNGGGPDAGNEPDANNGGVDGNPNTDGCLDEAKLIYVVDEGKQLSQFDPKTKTFNDLGTLACPTTAKPFSMAIARDATAWVLYDNGDLFRVDTKNSLQCTKSAWVRSTSGLTKFGMGFSTDQVGGTTDTLFVSGGASVSDSMSKLARVDLTSFQPAQVGYVTGWPELTGTGSAELWGFFPGLSSRIVQINKASAAEITSYRQASLDFDPNGSGSSAWAFAFHGGSFWVFLRKTGESQTTVYQVSTATGMIVGNSPAAGRSIVGAGVSTCAPVVIF